MKKTSFNKLLEILLRPFTKHFLFLIAFFALGTSPCFIWDFYKHGMAYNGIIVTVHCFIFSYFVTLLIGLIKNVFIRKTIQTLLMIFSAVYFAVNFYCIFGLGYPLDGDYVRLILGTDLNEAREFASVMLPKWIIFSVLGIFLFWALLALISTKWRLNLGKKTSKVALGATCVCLAWNAYAWEVWQEGPIHRVFILTQNQVPDDLTAYFSHPEITIQDKSELPCNVVLIIGESFARCHSSLYGYDKTTNPRLKALQDSSLLFTFDSIDSPAPTTAESLKLLLSTFSQRDDSPSNGKQWHEYTTIIELMQDCGFNSYWFGNQSLGGKFNSVSRVYAEACQNHKFLQREGSEQFIGQYDMVLVDSSYQYVNSLNEQGHHFIVYHMMGSHFDFNKRYPSEFDRFHESDYPKEPTNHRSTLASYDNSILYNDYVVERIMSLFKDMETIIIYIPDHGQVMYRNANNPNYFAHGNSNDSVGYALGVEIPFFIYASPLFQQKHPETMERIKNRQDNPKMWNSDDLPYLIMDIIGVNAINGQSIADKSLLN